MTTIQHLRELLAMADVDSPMGNSDERVYDVRDNLFCTTTWSEAAGWSGRAELIVAAINALPALLAVAEAAKHDESIRDRPVTWDEYICSRTALRESLAALEKPDHDAPRTCSHCAATIKAGSENDLCENCACYACGNFNPRGHACHQPCEPLRKP